MTGLSLSEAATPLGFALARLAISEVARRAHHDANALAVCSFVRELVRYTHEAPETIATLPWLVRLKAGDCDDMACAVVALLLRLGYPLRDLRWGIGWRGNHPAHVWVSVYTPRLKRWIPLDASTFELECGQDPADIGRFTRVTYHPLRF